jgi:hypothetical protein
VLLCVIKLYYYLKMKLLLKTLAVLLISYKVSSYVIGTDISTQDEILGLHGKSISDPIKKWDDERGPGLSYLMGYGYLRKNLRQAFNNEAIYDPKTKGLILYKKIIAQDGWQHIVTRIIPLEINGKAGTDWAFSIIYHEKKKKIAIICSGSNTGQQLKDEFSMLYKSMEIYGDHIEIFQYFGFVYKEAKDPFYKDLHESLGIIRKAVGDDIGNYQVLFLGHSLGGAMAQLLIYDTRRYDDLFLKNDKNNVYGEYGIKLDPIVISYGSPKVGNIYFAIDFHKKVKGFNNYRVVNKDDFIATLPPCRYDALQKICINELGISDFDENTDIGNIPRFTEGKPAFWHTKPYYLVKDIMNPVAELVPLSEYFVRIQDSLAQISWMEIFFSKKVKDPKTRVTGAKSKGVVDTGGVKKIGPVDRSHSDKTRVKKNRTSNESLIRLDEESDNLLSAKTKRKHTKSVSSGIKIRNSSIVVLNNKGQATFKNAVEHQKGGLSRKDNYRKSINPIKVSKIDSEINPKQNLLIPLENERTYESEVAYRKSRNLVRHDLPFSLLSGEVEQTPWSGDSRHHSTRTGRTNSLKNSLGSRRQLRENSDIIPLNIEEQQAEGICKKRDFVDLDADNDEEIYIGKTQTINSSGGLKKSTEMLAKLDMTRVRRTLTSSSCGSTRGHTRSVAMKLDVAEEPKGLNVSDTRGNNQPLTSPVKGMTPPSRELGINRNYSYNDSICSTEKPQIKLTNHRYYYKLRLAEFATTQSSILPWYYDLNYHPGNFRLIEKIIKKMFPDGLHS